MHSENISSSCLCIGTLLREEIWEAGISGIAYAPSILQIKVEMLWKGCENEGFSIMQYLINSMIFEGANWAFIVNMIIHVILGIQANWLARYHITTS